MDDISLSKLDNETLDIDNMSDIGDIEIKSTKSSKSSKKKKPLFKKSVKPKSMIQQFNKPIIQPVSNQPPRPSPPNNNVFRDFNDKSFEMFSNPQKRVPTNLETMSKASSENEEDPFNEDNEEEDEQPDYGNEFEQEENNELGPSEGFQTIDDEKQDLLYKFHRIEQKGIKVKKFTMYSDIREMRAEFNKIKKDSEMTSGVKFSKRMLMAVVSGMEFLNKRYDPLGMELNGWSESVMENMSDGDYDNVLEKLHEKYAGKVNTPPEMELMLSLTGSAVMFHMTSTMFKSVGSNINEFAKQNPNMMQDILKKATQSTQQNKTNQEDYDEEEQHDSNGRHTMKGPSMDLSNMGSMFGVPPPMSTSMERNQGNNQSLIVDETPDQSEMSEQISVNDDIREVSLASTTTGSKRGRKKKARDAEKGFELDI